MNNKISCRYNVDNIFSIFSILSVVLIIGLLTTDLADAASWKDYLNGAWKDGGNALKTTVGSMFANFDASGRVAIALVKFVALIAGFIMIINAALKAIRFSDGKEAFAPIMYTLLTGALLISFIPVIDMTSNTLGFGSNASNSGLDMICDYDMNGCDKHINTIEEHTKAALIGLITFIRLVGFIAIFRGIVALHERGKSGGGQKSLAQPLFFIIGGALCVNCVYFAMIGGNTLVPKSGFTKFFTDSEIGSAINPNK